MPHHRHLLGLLLLALALLATPALAQNPPPAARPAPAPAAPAAPRGPLSPPIIGVVDTAQIQEQAIAMKSIRDQMQKEEQSFRADLTKRQTDLRNAEQELSQQRTLLSADAFAERRRAFETQAGDSERFMAARKRQLDTAFANGMREVETVLNGILKEIATERGLNLILPRGALMLLVDNNLDITDDVRRRLDTRLKSVAIKLPPLQK
ncbi:MAG: OmpH family outer membrane protein [Alphaproteobacteria bacterium]|nr:OmpH family outer membrane protein [Alphaproteobacteria bacterium]